MIDKYLSTTSAGAAARNNGEGLLSASNPQRFLVGRMLSAASRALGSKPRKHVSAGNGFHFAALQILVTAIERFSR